MMKHILTLFFILALIVSNALSQDDIQSFQAKVNEIKAKPVAQLTTDDIKFLESIISMNSQKFGGIYQKVVDAQKSIAKTKLKEYDIWLKEKNRSDSLNLELGTEKLKTQAQGEVIKAQSDTIANQNMIIAKLKDDILQLKRQITRTRKTNKKLKDEKTALEQIINDNNEIISRVRELLSDDISVGDSVPADIKAELEDSECQIAELISENYILSLEKLKKDKEYLTKIREYFQENKTFPDIIYEYLDEGQKILLKLRESNVPCVNAKANQVKASIEEFKQVIESQDECNFFCQIGNFIADNLWLAGIIILLIIGIILIFVVRR